MPPGGALALTGPNGSGKSSLLRLMAGLTPPETGVLAWDGRPVRDDPAAHRARLHFIGHHDAVKPALTVAETLAFWAGMRGGSKRTAALERFGLAALAAWPCRLLSAGQRRRLALARLVASPADSDAVADLAAAIAAQRAQGGLVVFSTHAALPLDGAETLSLTEYAARAA